MRGSNRENAKLNLMGRHGVIVDVFDVVVDGGDIVNTITVMRRRVQKEWQFVGNGCRWQSTECSVQVLAMQ